MLRNKSDLVGSLLHDVAHLIRLRIDRELRAFGLTRIKGLALGIVQRRPAISQSELAAELELGEATVGQLVSRLEARGFIERRPAENDRRAKRLYLTPKTERILSRLQRVGSDLRGEILQGVAEEELGRLERELKKIKSNLTAAALPAIALALFKPLLTQPDLGETALLIL